MADDLLRQAEFRNAAESMLREHNNYADLLSMVASMLARIGQLSLFSHELRHQLNETQAALLRAEPLADDAARSDIERNCLLVDRAGREIRAHAPRDDAWYDITRLTDHDAADTIAAALFYLAARHLLQTHPTNPQWVRPLSVK